MNLRLLRKIIVAVVGGSVLLAGQRPSNPTDYGPWPDYNDSNMDQSCLF